MNSNIAALIEKHLNATLTAAEAATLALAMAENPALAEEFAAATRMEADLSSAMKEKERTALYTRRMERAAAETAPARIRRPWPVKTMTAAAGLAALIGIGWRLLEVEPGNKTTAKKGSPASPLASAGDGSHASPSRDTRPADASAMKRKLRRFASSTSRLRSVPVSQALAALQSEWKNYAHQNAKDKDAVFVVAEAVRQLWKQPEDEPAVSLEIPGISLLTSLELIAAQAGLKTTVTAAGVSMEPFPRKDDGKERTWSIPLSLASVSTFMSRASRQPQEAQPWGRHVESYYFKLADMSHSMKPSWMENPPKSASNWTYYSNSPSGQPIDGRISTWADSDLSVSAGEPLALKSYIGDIYIGDITQPVIATRVLIDYPGNLTRLLAAHGMPAEGATWDQEHGVVVARGPLSQLRAAQAAATAVEEAATSGVMVEMKVIEWKNGIPAPEADRSGLLPPPVAGKSDTLTAADASDLLGDPDLDRVGEANATQQLGMPLRLKEAKGEGGYFDAGTIADVSGITGRGLSWHVPVKIRREDTTISGIARSREEIESGGHRFDLQLQDGEWLRVDFPASGDTKALTVLLGVQPATVQP